MKKMQQNLSKASSKIIKVLNIHNLDRKLIFLDLDGTTLNKNSLLSTKNINTIQRLKSDHLICLITGRPARASLEFYNKLGLKTILTNYNGARIWNPHDNSFSPINYVINQNIAFSFFQDLLIRKNATNVIMETKKSVILKHKNDHHINDYFHINLENKNVFIGNNYYQKIDSDLYSIMITTKDKETKWKIFEIIKNYASELNIREWDIEGSDKPTIEITSKFADKLQAAKVISSYYNIPYQNVYAFGDSFNDAEILKWVTNSYAMKNSNDNIKSLSRFITEKTNEESGVGYQLEQIFNLSN